MNSFKNLSDFPGTLITLLQVYDFERKSEVCIFSQKSKNPKQESLMIDELTINIKNISLSNTQKNTFNRLESSISGLNWAFWIDAFDYLYIGHLTSLLPWWNQQRNRRSHFWDRKQFHFRVSKRPKIKKLNKRKTALKTEPWIQTSLIRGKFWQGSFYWKPAKLPNKSRFIPLQEKSEVRKTQLR